MARYKPYSYDQQLMIPGTFEYTLNALIDDKLDLSLFHERFKNDETGAPAYDPAILLKIILFAYSKGINTSRKIEKFCQENIVCMALAADTRPHFTTIADFISSMDKECADLFTRILAVCYTENLIGKNMFAIDGCKISSNCSKEWSGTKEELLNKVEKIRKSINYLVSKHQADDNRPETNQEREKEKASIRKLKAKADKITEWLESNDDKLGSRGKPVKSNVIDNESAKMATSHGVIQGYKGTAWMGHLGNCQGCGNRNRCLRNCNTKARQVVIFDRTDNAPGSNYSARMRKRFDTPEGMSLYSKRMGTVEPVFVHIVGTKRLNRFTLRSRKKVRTQWLVYCIVHNIGKLQVWSRIG